MARRPARAPLDVFLNARPVGRLRRLGSGAVDFRYDPGWLGWEHALPISNSLPLREDRYLGDPVIAVFDNLLPDPEPMRRPDRGTDRRRRPRCVQPARQARRRLRGRADRRTGRRRRPRCVQPARQARKGLRGGAPDPARRPRPPPRGNGRRKAPGGRQARSRRNSGTSPIAPLGLDEDAAFRISIAGAQEKTALLYWNDKWHIPRGATATTHIMKPQIGMLPNGIDLSRSVENEHLCLRPRRRARPPQRGDRDRGFRRRARPGRRTVRPPLDRRRASSASAAGRLLPGAVGAAVPEIRRRRRSRHDRYSRSAAGKRCAGNRPAHVRQGPDRLLAARRDGRPRQEFQHLPEARRTFPDEPLYDVMSCAARLVKYDADRRVPSMTGIKLAICRAGDSRRYGSGTILPRHVRVRPPQIVFWHARRDGSATPRISASSCRKGAEPAFRMTAALRSSSPAHFPAVDRRFRCGKAAFEGWP